MDCFLYDNALRLERVKEFDYLTIFINIATALAQYSTSSSFDILLFLNFFYFYFFFFFAWRFAVNKLVE